MATQELPELTFEHFLMSLATAALVHLGQVPHPETNEKKVDLEQAKQNIDILGMLHDKTKGNLTDAEKTVLEGALGQLRLTYVSMSK
jgi:hypothetical protein